ncbi:superinfection immunity protein [Vibrio vulnificus]|uniref:superinfection immunity protein n=1 Tax=Vibrio TaxID=662 RepID=UPI001A2632B7|nr:superinfection immunity protein [Vibrio vulnificus]EGQ8029045.1 superinfection immunity protein [Vibrio vulnificus]EGQ8088725.1 superinfection immunity protein [Vibrio vulnificus]EGR1894246.1 superinfection immunity protein [Vibrio vulnificus]EHH0850236.1 superinfection immunity protein [Vibrio vulnificus]EHK9018631.1 superinfection immunity protein [Vibrio vulnificus]
MSSDGLSLIITLLLMLTIGLLPTIIAFKRNHPYRVAILIVNVVGGLAWGAGWVVAFVWCFVLPKSEEVIDHYEVAEEIEKLHGLKEKGIISEREFTQKKEDLLNL